MASVNIKIIVYEILVNPLMVEEDINIINVSNHVKDLYLDI